MRQADNVLPTAVSHYLGRIGPKGSVPHVRRPVLTPAGCRLWYRFADYARKYISDPRDLPSVASDVMDGRYEQFDPEVQNLTKRRLIRRVRGRGYTTWELTEDGCELLSRVPLVPEYVI